MLIGKLVSCPDHNPNIDPNPNPDLSHTLPYQITLTEYPDLTLSIFSKATFEGLREPNILIYFFFHPSRNRDLFPMFCLLVEGECQILVF